MWVVVNGTIEESSDEAAVSNNTTTGGRECGIRARDSKLLYQTQYTKIWNREVFLYFYVFPFFGETLSFFMGKSEFFGYHVDVYSGDYVYAVKDRATTRFLASPDIELPLHIGAVGIAPIHSAL